MAVGPLEASDGKKVQGGDEQAQRKDRVLPMLRQSKLKLSIKPRIVSCMDDAGVG